MNTTDFDEFGGTLTENTEQINEAVGNTKEAEKIAKSLVFSYAEIISDMIEGAENEIDGEIEDLKDYKSNSKKMLSAAYSAFKKELKKELAKRIK